ncbi:hypothetical protein N8317_01615 [Gammaproteobacteria bacterium]|nr:hypothetical protein [Gammaproteobacteria bacterium]
MKHTLLDKSFEALYQNLDDIKALRIKRAWDEFVNIYYLKDKKTLNELYVEQEIIANGLIENLRTIEDNFTPDEKDEVIDKLSNLLKRDNA